MFNLGFLFLQTLFDTLDFCQHFLQVSILTMQQQ